MIVPTRMELLAVKARKKLALKGKSLLKKKQDVLIKHFFTLVEEYRTHRTSIQEELVTGYKQLAEAEAYAGFMRVRGAAFIQQHALELHLKKDNIMGVPLDQLSIKESTPEQRYGGIGTSVKLVQTKKTFASLLAKVIKVAELEQNLKRLADEIQKTKRRVNTLEYVKIPEFEEQEKYIKFRLSEMERESFSRLKHLKGKR